MRILDLFCGEGGAGMGYHRAGFDVVGVDHRRMNAYPFEFIRGDAVEYARQHAHEFDAIHASPPCKLFTPLQAVVPEEAPRLVDVDRHQNLIPPTRAVLQASGLPWVMENVPRSPLLDPLILCGSMFGLGAQVDDNRMQLRRHRLFESTEALTPPGKCQHSGQAIGVYGRLSAWSGNLQRRPYGVGNPSCGSDGHRLDDPTRTIAGDPAGLHGAHRPAIARRALRYVYCLDVMSSRVRDDGPQ